MSFAPARTDTFGLRKNRSPTRIVPRRPSLTRLPGGASMFTALPPRRPTIGTVNAGAFRRPDGARKLGEVALGAGRTET